MPCSVDLRQLVEALAMRLVMDGAESSQPLDDWMAAIEAIRRSALSEQAQAVAEAAGSAIRKLGGPGDRDGWDGGASAAAFEDAVASLQQAIDAESHPTPATGQIAQDPELLGDFVLESREHLTAIESHVLTLERDPANAEALHAAFRGFHTIKGLAGFLELWEVQKLAHEVETVLDRARNSELTLGPSSIDVILLSADCLRGWLAHVESQLHGESSPAPAHDEGLLDRIRGLYAAPGEKPAPSLAALAQAVETGGEAPRKAADSAVVRDPRHEAMAVKVDTAKLDYLVDMAGEMVIAESLVRHDGELAAARTPQLQRKMAQLTRITAELQRTAMSMRLVPIGPLFHRMARLVRDLARQFGKTVELETSGDDVELDRTIVEELSDPLMHMVRNSVDHGIENPRERQERGKPPLAHVYLKAHHQSGQVVVEVADDGRGLDRERIRAKAIERGLIAEGRTLSDTESYNLIFEPGFSTAEKVSNVSGRGVGMDVVRRHIEKLHGRIEIHSTPGAGTAFYLKLPLTLAIIDGLVVGVGPERYIVPLSTVREMFRPTGETIWTIQNRAEMALVRGALLPVLRLYRRFQVTPRSEDPLQSILIVAEAEGQRFCLLVDDLIGKQEVVIKSLGETFKKVTGVAGGAILGDGRVGLILDPDRLFRERNGDPAF